MYFIHVVAKLNFQQPVLQSSVSHDNSEIIVKKKCIIINIENVLDYYRNLGSLRYGNEYCIEYRCCMEKNSFSSLTDAREIFVYVVKIFD